MSSPRANYREKRPGMPTTVAAPVIARANRGVLSEEEYRDILV
ncbi:MAG: hypothetical protein OEM91_02185 [Hyphomicrobiales bacterium]|nr:hypothetical protein [Hyphomicrobiales bacterium]